MNQEFLRLFLTGGKTGGEDLVAMMMKQMMGGIIPPNSMFGDMANEYIEEDAAPWVRKQLFGNDILAGYGGFNAAWNPMSRMQQHTSKQMRSRMSTSMGKVIKQHNTDMMDQFRQANPDLVDGMGLEEFTQWAGTSLLGAKNIGRSFVNNRSSFGVYNSFGGVNDLRENRANAARLTTASTAMTKAFLNDRGSFGNVDGSELGTLIGFEAKRGELDLDNPQQMVQRMQKTAKAISGIRDIIKGPMSEVIKQLESTFGGAAINTFGLEGAASKMHQMRQFAEMTGTTVGQVAQYSRASGLISNQIAGHNLGAGGAGLTTAAFMAGGFGRQADMSNLKGVDLNSLNSTMVQRVTGAQQSATSLKVAATIVAMRQAGASDEDIANFKAKVGNFKGDVNSSSLAAMAQDVNSELGISSSTIEQGQYSRSARDQAAEDSTGTYVAMKQTRGLVFSHRKQMLKSRLGANYKEGDEQLSLRQLEKKLVERGVSGASGIVGSLTKEYDMLANEFGYKSSEEMTVTMQQMEKAQNLEERSARAGAFAEKFSETSSGLAGFLRKVAVGGDIGDAFKKMAGIMTDPKKKQALLDMIGNKKTQDFLQEGGISKTESEARQKVVMEKLKTLSSGVDAEGNELTQQEWEDLAKQVEEGDYTEDMKKEKKTLKYKLNEISKGKYEYANFEDKKKYLTATLKDKLQGQAGFSDQMDLKQMQKFVSENKEDLIAGGIFTKDEVEAVEQGVKKSPEEWLETIQDWLKQIFDKIPD